jgi:ADP-heptose:LPS heptosyltransferase
MSDAREGAAILHTWSVPVDARAHAVERCWRFVEAFGVSGDIPTVASDLPGGEPIAHDLPERFILLHPFARGGGKSLDVFQIHRLVAALDPVPVVIVGLTRSAWPPAPLGRAAIDLTNRTSLLELVWLMRRAGFVISVDSGPMHLASALGRPLLAIHTWSDPRKVGPYAAEADIWKGRQITRRQNVDDALAERSDLPGEADFRAIAEHALRRWEKGPNAIG